MKELKVLGVCAGQGALLFPFRKHLIGNIEIRGVFHTPGEEQWKANFGDIPFHKGFCLQEFDKKVDIAREKYLKPLLKDEVLKEVKYV